MLYKYRVPFCIISLLVLMVISALIALSVVKNRSEKKLHKAYEQEKQALAVAERASAAKGGFMSRMSHEIRTPLNAVIGYNNIARSELALAHDENGRRQAEMKVLDCLTKSEMASKHLLTIINDVLDMSAIESGKIQVAHERFDFKNMILSLTALFYSQSKAKDVEFEVVFDTLTEEWFVGDQMRVNQILTNLLSNAVKFTPPGGSVRLIIRQPEAETNAAHIHFEIKDSGIGMSAEYMKDLWAPFEQADSSISRRFGGTGLGLSITKSLVDLMGGSINAESQPGEGTTFSVDLTFERAEQSKDTGAYDFSKINALVVDDDASTCDYIQMLFTRCGVRCTAVTSGKDAVELFSKNLGTENGFTACLVDWRMPQMDGIKTVKCIKSLAQDDVAIVVVTAYDFSEIADAAKEAGADMFVSKPLFQSSLFDLLANISGAAPEKLERDKEFDFAGVRVLLAEDNEMNMEVACHMLASVGLEVDCAENGRAAADMFCNAPAGTYGAILMDIHMPEMDGHQASRAIRSSGHEEAMTIPIIAMTADAFAENVAEAKASGMNDHIAKPIDSEKLFKTLSKYI